MGIKDAEKEERTSETETQRESKRTKSYMMEYVTQALWQESNIGSFTPY